MISLCAKILIIEQKAILNTQKTSKCSKNTYKSLSNKKDINLCNILYATQQSKIKLQDLYKFANNNHHDVNSAFEPALYETNMAGVGAFFLMLVPPIGLVVKIGNAEQ